MNKRRRKEFPIDMDVTPGSKIFVFTRLLRMAVRSFSLFLLRLTRYQSSQDVKSYAYILLPHCLRDWSAHSKKHMLLLSLCRMTIAALKGVLDQTVGTSLVIVFVPRGHSSHFMVSVAAWTTSVVLNYVFLSTTSPLTGNLLDIFSTTIDRP